jgi:HlyD family secretion protein
MRRRFLIGSLVTLAILAGAGAWWLTHRQQTPRELTLYGNVDLREVDLAFNNAERIAAVLAHEGERVKQGQILAQLDTSRLAPQMEQAEAQAAAQQAILDKLRHGNRPEEIAQARANVALAQAEATVARQKYQRMRTLSQSSDGRALSSQDLDDAKAGADTADARLAVSRSALRRRRHNYVPLRRKPRCSGANWRIRS